MNKLAAYAAILEDHPLWEGGFSKEAIFLNPAHAAIMMYGPAVTGGIGGYLGAGEDNRLMGALAGIPAGYLGTAAGLLSGLDNVGARSAVLGGAGAGYLAGRTVREVTRENA